MKIGCICPTYKRPELLGRAIHCFLQQTYTDSCLIVLDDAGQYKSAVHDRWMLISTPNRYNSLGGKRQAGIDMLPRECDAYMAWDDDDVYWPNAIASVVAALKLRPWAQARVVYETVGPGKLQATEAFRIYKSKPDKVTWGYGGCWGYRLAEHRMVGGYEDNPDRSSNDDLDLARKFFDTYGISGSSTPDSKPWYWYNRDPNVNKISTEGIHFWEKRGDIPCEAIESPPIGWNGPNVYDYQIMDGVQPRPF